MKISPAKENILKKIRQALSHSTPIPFPQSEGNTSVFTASPGQLEVEFAEKFTGLQGKFIFCLDHREMAAQLRKLAGFHAWNNLFCQEDKIIQILKDQAGPLTVATGLEQSDAAITSCELLIARTGSIVMSAAQPSGRTVSVYAPVHICLAYTSQLVYDIREGLSFLKEKYGGRMPSLITLATGPSRTADIEKTLVVGVHGPREVYVFLVDEQS